MSAIAKAIIGEAVQMMDLAELMAKVTPGDYRSYTWPQVFRSIELNHYGPSAAHWDKFLDSVREHGIKHPVYIERRGDRLELVRGHHRVWAAHKLGLAQVPVTIAVIK